MPGELPYELGGSANTTPMRFESAILRVLPPWLRRTVGGQLMAAFGEVVDTMVDRTAVGAKLRFPGLVDDEALPYIGRDRVIRRGPNEPASTYAARLNRWWTDHQRRGGAYALLRQLEAYYAAAPRRIDLVYHSGTRRWFVPAAAPITNFEAGTFTRATPATYWDGTTLTRYAAGELRVVTKDGYKGYILEQARTNVLEWSNDLTQSPWTVSGTVTTRAYGMVGPSGESDATRIVWSAAEGYVFNAVPVGEVPDSTDFVFSFWARSISGAASVRVIVNRRDGTFGLHTVAITSSWARYSVSENFQAGGSASVVNLNNDAAAKEVYFFGLQVEVGAFPTSLVETAGAAATRNADELSAVIEDNALAVRWLGLFEPAATLAQRASGSYTMLWREELDEDTDIRIGPGSSGVDASLFREALGGTPNIAGFDYAVGDRLRFLVDAPGGTLRIEGSTPDGSVEDAGVAFDFEGGVAYKPLLTTGSSAQSGWVSDIYPATGTDAILATIEAGATPGEIVRDSVAWDADGDPLKWAQAWLIHYVDADPGVLTAEQEEQYRAIPRDWNAGHVLPIHVVLIWDDVDLWGYPVHTDTWGDGSLTTWAEGGGAIIIEAE